MFAKITTLTLLGLEAREVAVEVDIRSGLFAINIVGLAGKSVQESKERVFAAIRNSGFEMPMRRITINLSPADLAKNSSNFDLPIATGILVATKQIDLDLKSTIVWGELSLAGKTLKSRGALAVAHYAKLTGYKNLVLPQINAVEAGIVTGINVIGVTGLADMSRFQNFSSETKINARNRKKDAETSETNNSPKPSRSFAASSTSGSSSLRGQIMRRDTTIETDYDFAFIKGQKTVRRVAEIAAAGGHNLLLNGVPGSGKTFLGRCFAGILPTMQYQEMIEVTKIHSIAGLLKEENLISKRPFRSPHHTCSDVALIGGGGIPKPGEITLSHRGVLFLDEFNEFNPKALESLRQPIEDKIVHISRASGSIVYPANFMLIAAMNPCKCGFNGDADNTCTCSQYDLEKFKRKLSGPILDRIDLQTYVNKVSKTELLSDTLSESSVKIRERVETARKRQILRFRQQGITDVYANADLSNIQLKKSANLDFGCNGLLEKAIDALGLSARGYFRLVKVARTIADLEGSEKVGKAHITEAIGYRIIV